MGVLPQPVAGHFDLRTAVLRRGQTGPLKHFFPDPPVPESGVDREFHDLGNCIGMVQLLLEPEVQHADDTAVQLADKAETVFIS